MSDNYLWSDGMDSTRYVRVVKELGQTLLCRVYFHDDHSKPAQFCGLAEIPKNLFNNINSRIGFN